MGKQMPTKKCDDCGRPLTSRWWQNVPNQGDFCDDCHSKWLNEITTDGHGTPRDGSNGTNSGARTLEAETQGEPGDGQGKEVCLHCGCELDGNRPPELPEGVVVCEECYSTWGAEVLGALIGNCRKHRREKAKKSTGEGTVNNYEIKKNKIVGFVNGQAQVIQILSEEEIEIMELWSGYPDCPTWSLVGEGTNALNKPCFYVAMDSRVTHEKIIERRTLY
jgi:hypothetical protein